MEDIGEGKVSASTVAKEHSKEAGRDMKQWGHELRQAGAGAGPGEAKVRDVPPMTEADNADTIDRVSHKDTTPAGANQPPRADTKYNQN
jgi:hypothetical protein